uniref:C-type lectin domain-containing protein n=1 Tax=Steinernema glaseri TaxID=37863 RepID=A0A1I7YRU2_9BILA
MAPQVLQDRGQCDQKNDPKCQQLKDLDIHCKAVNTTGCTLSCGENEIRKAPDFTFCCPAYEKENGQKACCPDGERVIPGAKECCATITLPKGKQVCCPKKTFPGNDKNGIELCCPEKESCCPEGQEIATSSAEGVAICCPKGMTVIDGTSKCCLNDFDYTDVFGKCVGVVNFDRIPTSTKELMQLCADKKSSPVKIENEDQNKYLRGGKFRNALIGLAIPDDQEWAEDGFRWLVDGSKPTFVNWVAEEPNNGDGMSDEIERFVLLHNKGSKWKDVSSTDIEPFIICMAEAHEGSEY